MEVGKGKREKVKKLSAFILCSFCFMLYCSAFAAQKQNSKVGPIDAIVDYIFDGDTFSAHVVLENDVKISVRVRILQIDAPEMNGECDAEIEKAIAAKKRLADLLPEGKRIQLYDVKDDKYLGRIDANVRDFDGRDIGAIMLRENHARPYSGGARVSWCD